MWLKINTNVFDAVKKCNLTISHYGADSPWRLGISVESWAEGVACLIV